MLPIIMALANTIGGLGGLVVNSGNSGGGTGPIVVGG